MNSARGKAVTGNRGGMRKQRPQKAPIEPISRQKTVITCASLYKHTAFTL